MKRDCSTCICKEGSCYPSTTIFDKDKTCKSYSPDYERYIAELEKENAELKEEISTKDILIKELQEQKVYWKESSFDWRHKFFKLDKVKRLIKKDKQLAQAKKLLAKLLEEEKNNMYWEMNGSDKSSYYEVRKQAEQFISEVEK